jgi:hypothetical protein
MPPDPAIFLGLAKSRTVMNKHLGYLLLLFGLIGGGPFSVAAAETPLVPIISGFRHWDHHWYIWLPGDEVYEAVEIMAAERGPNTVPLVWVFFTERDGPKKQIHYYNDAGFAAALGGQLRDISFSMTGSEGEPRGVSVSLVDFKDRPVAIDVQLSPEARFTNRGAGLTNQIGHSGDIMLLVFFREKNAFARAWQVVIAGNDVATQQRGQSRAAPFPAAYSSNIFVGRFPFVDWLVSFDMAHSGDDKDRARFVSTGMSGNYLTDLRDGTRVELASAADAGLQYYRHRNGAHLLEISFDPPLPPPDRVAAGVDSTYRISLDGFRDLLAGSVHAVRRDDAITLDWHFETPDWTRTRSLRTTASFKDGSIARVELRPVLADQ